MHKRYDWISLSDALYWMERGALPISIFNHEEALKNALLSDEVPIRGKASHKYQRIKITADIEFSASLNTMRTKKASFESVQIDRLRLQAWLKQLRLNTEQIARLLAISRCYATLCSEYEPTWKKAHDEDEKYFLHFAVKKARDPERIEAVKRLICEYQLQIAEYKRRERAAIDPLLMQGVGDWGRYIFAQANPEMALGRLLGTKQKPGKRATNTDRNADITLAVIAEMEGGMTLEEAVTAVATDHCLAEDTIRKIYARRKSEARAARWEI